MGGYGGTLNLNDLQDENQPQPMGTTYRSMFSTVLIGLRTQLPQ